MVTSKDGYLEVVRELAKHSLVDLNVMEKRGRTDLNFATMGFQVNVVREPLKHNHVDVNFSDNDGHTSLMWAVRWRYPPEVVRDLCEHERVHVNVPNKNGATALVLACRNDHWLVVEELLKRKDVGLNAAQRLSWLYRAPLGAPYRQNECGLCVVGEPHQS